MGKERTARAVAGGRTARRAHLAGLSGAAALALGVPAVQAAAGAATGPGADPAVVTDWNAAAVATIVTDAGKANAEAFCWFAFTQAAVHNAVVGITGRYALYKWGERGPATASPEAAAAAAANRVLLTYFGHLPAARARLADTYAATLARVPGGPARDQGVLYGERAADRIIALRADDGRFAPVAFTTPPAPGVWRPTPPAMAPFFAPWLSQLRPMTLTADGGVSDWASYNADSRAWGASRNPDGTVRSDAAAATGVVRFRAAPPPALTSAAYAADFEEVKALGAKASARRTAAQTETALFINSIPFAPLQESLRDLTIRRGMDISDRARLFAAVDASIADAVSVSWDSKYHYGFWRPITAIHQAAADGNPATEGDPSWEPLLVTPPYPDHTSGLCSVVGSATRALSRVLDSNRIDLYLASPATNTTRYYESVAALCQDAENARVWSGIHFRTADVAAIAAGTQVADWALDHFFRPAL